MVTANTSKNQILPVEKTAFSIQLFTYTIFHYHVTEDKRDTMNQFMPSQKILHWGSALIILGLFILGVWMRTLDYYHSWYVSAPTLHKSWGVLLTGIIIFRLIWRFRYSMPNALDSHKKWEVTTAYLTHRAMLLLTLVIIATGYLISTADDKGIEVFGLFELPTIINAFEQQEDISGFIHKWAAYALIALVVLHSAGALKHHFVDKDSTLKRML